MKHPFHQTLLYEIHSRIFCKENQSRIDEFATTFFHDSATSCADEIWLMGIWEMSPTSQKIARSHSGLRNEFKKALQNVSEEDILSSPYAVFDYNLNPLLTDADELARFRNRLSTKNQKLILDFVPNHMAIDTPYLDSHPNCFLTGDKLDKNHFKHTSGKIYAHGKDPYFDGWTDTVQWDFSNPATLELHKQIVLKIADYCDGVRCDMAMLALPDVFFNTHNKTGVNYWNELIRSVKNRHPHFKFYAEAYWNREYDLQTLGFDGTYDKTLYDRLSHTMGISVCEHLDADLPYQNKSIRFLENHDEERAIAHFSDNSKYFFSLLCFLPGILLYYQGQELGNQIKLPVQLGKRDIESPNINISKFYERIFSILKNRPTNIERTILNYILYGDGRILAYLLSYPANQELLIWNPMPQEISGKVFIGETVNLQSDFVDQVSDEIFPKPTLEELKTGIYFKLKPGQAQWFIF